MLACRTRAVVAAIAVAGIGRPQAEQGLLVAAAAAVDGHRHRVTARLLRTLHHRLRHLPFVGGVELVPDRLAARAADVLDPEAGRGRQDLQMISNLGGAGGGDLALVVKRPLAADRRQHDGARIFHAENFDRHVDLADVDQPPRAQLKLQEALAIGAQRDLVIDAGRHVAEMRGRNVAAADRLEIKDVDRFLGRLDELGGAHRRPHQRVGKLGPGRRPFAGEGFEPAGGEQRTSGQELQELATAGGLIGE